MRRNHLLIPSVFLFLLVIEAIGQNPSTVTQEAKSSQCSNIVALAGDVKIDCTSLTPAQQKLVESIPGLLHKILVNQLDPNTVTTKLDEILKEVRRIDPSGPVVSYTTNGYKRVARSGQISMMIDDNLPTCKVFQQMETANANRDWQSLASLADQAIKETPEWLTPYEFRVVAYVNLGKMTGNEAVLLLVDLKAKIGDNHDYTELATQVDGALRQVRSKGY
jgi:hypothetical protein